MCQKTCKRDPFHYSVDLLLHFMFVIAVVILLVLVFCFRFVLLCFVFLFCFFIFFPFALRPTIVVCLYLMYTIKASDGRARGTARLKTDRV